MSDRKSERLFSLIGDIPDKMTDEALAGKKNRWYSGKTVIAAACFICVCAAVGIFAIISAPKWRVETVIIDNDYCEETARIPKWDEMTVPQRFSQVILSESSYDYRTELESERKGEKICDSTLAGYDIYEDTHYEKSAEVFSVEGISEKYAVAVCFDKEDGCYIYCSSDYTPDTLGGFVNELQLYETLEFNRVSYDGYIDFFGNRRTVTFEAPDSEKVWELLFSDGSVKTVTDYKENPSAAHFKDSDIMTVGISLPLFGLSNIALTVTDQGYMRTNILSSGKAFFVGKEKTDAFVEYVLHNLDGKIIEYRYEENASLPLPENEAAAENSMNTESAVATSVAYTSEKQ